MEDFVEQAKEVMGIEDSDEQKRADLRERVDSGDSTDRERKALDELEQKKEDEAPTS